MGQFANSARKKVATLALFLLALPGSVAAGESLPGWALSYAARDASAWKSRAPMVVLYEEGRLELLPSPGRFRYRVRVVGRILKPSMDSRMERVVVPISGDERITNLQAWTQQPSGKVIRLDPKQINEHSLFHSFELYSDIRFRSFVPPGLSAESVFAFEYEMEGNYTFPSREWYFGGNFPEGATLESVFEVNSQPGNPVKWRSYGLPGNPPEGEVSKQWRATDIAPLEGEPHMPAWHEVSPHVIINLPDPRRGALESWDDIAGWFWALYEPQRRVTPEIRKQADELIAGVSDPVEKIRRLTEFVQRNVRYVAIEIGIGGFQPHAAGAVLKNRYGDCKDKATLLAAMLSVAGIDADPVLLMAGDRTAVDRGFPSLRFNHAILAVRATGEIGERLKDMFAYSSRDGVLWIDPTSERASLGFLPGADQGGHVLIVSDARGKLTQTPLLAASQNGYRRKTQARLKKDGTLESETEEQYFGEEGLRVKSAFADLPSSERTEILERRLAKFGSARLSNISFDRLESNQGDVAIRYHAQLPGYSSDMGQLSALPAMPFSRIERYAVGEKRTQALDFEFGVDEEDTLSIQLPEGWQLDGTTPATDVQTEFGRYQLTVEANASGLKISRHFVLLQSYIPIEKVTAFRNFIRRAAAADHSQLVTKVTAASLK